MRVSLRSGSLYFMDSISNFTNNDARVYCPAFRLRALKNKITLPLLILIALTNSSLFANPYNLYVAPNGNDQWSGRMAAPAANGQDGPMATLPAALKAARSARLNAARVSEGI